MHKSYQKRKLLESHIKSVHKVPKNQIDFSKMPEHQSGMDTEDMDKKSVCSDNEPVVKRLRLDGDEQFTCAKCNFVSKDREEFQAHIAKHKSSEEDALQCNECGMSFMTQPSLKRHLAMVHKIRNMKRYHAESGIDLEAPVKAAELEGASRITRQLATYQNGYNGRESDSARDSDDMDGDSNTGMECTVCYKEFESEALLRKHMRMHGMAFIRSRRLDPSHS